jgi:hypothetical protein
MNKRSFVVPILISIFALIAVPVSVSAVTQKSSEINVCVDWTTKEIKYSKLWNKCPAKHTSMTLGSEGSSAYEIAVANGFVGTVDEWLTSLEGADGADGARGRAGSDGSGGSGAGPQGETGLQGIQGIQGDTGIQGIQGETGLQGIQGIQGDTGIQGIQGETGLQGIQGIQGETGLQGIQGIQGDQGAQGIQGETGLQGIQGLKGDQGVQGVKGDTGPAGPTIRSARDFGSSVHFGEYIISPNGSDVLAAAWNLPANSSGVWSYTVVLESASSEGPNSGSCDLWVKDKDGWVIGGSSGTTRWRLADSGMTTFPGVEGVPIYWGVGFGTGVVWVDDYATDSFERAATENRDINVEPYFELWCDPNYSPELNVKATITMVEVSDFNNYIIW